MSETIMLIVCQRCMMLLGHLLKLECLPSSHGLFCATLRFTSMGLIAAHSSPRTKYYSNTSICCPVNIIALLVLVRHSETWFSHNVAGRYFISTCLVKARYYVIVLPFLFSVDCTWFVLSPESVLIADTVYHLHTGSPDIKLGHRCLRWLPVIAASLLTKLKLGMIYLLNVYLEGT